MAHNGGNLLSISANIFRVIFTVWVQHNVNAGRISVAARIFCMLPLVRIGPIKWLFFISKKGGVSV